ncbi:cupin domain-containing protein [Longispora sp. K20-0274]|uniref:cupin domain-containing protein n=1 Tax=Longispora sp. K20-0274 TaxID=3088255 RepID=UPI00399B8746
MRTFTSNDAALTNEYGIQVGRWSQYENLSGLPFDAMWCVIEPGGSTTEHGHPEVEYMVVLSGFGRLTTPNAATEIEPGTVLLLDSDETHVIDNLSDSERLVLLSTYWLPGTNGPTA